MAEDVKKELCSCDAAGLCERRGCYVGEQHWLKCRAGAIVSIDRLYRRLTEDSDIDQGAKRKSKVLEISSIGTSLSEVIRRETGEGIPCGQCKEEILRLNSMSVEEVQLSRDQIVSGILERGRMLLGWWRPKRWAIGLAPGQVRLRINRWLDEAIRNSSISQESAPQSGAISVIEVSSSPLKSGASLLSEEQQRIAAGLDANMPRSKVILQRKAWKRAGFSLPPLAPTRGMPVNRAQNLVWPVGSAFTHHCIHLGSPIYVDGCNCGSRNKAVVFKCNHPATSGLCTLEAAPRSPSVLNDDLSNVISCRDCQRRDTNPRYITVQQLAVDVLKLMSKVPHHVTTVAGVARSGLAAASLVSMIHHLPLDIIRQEQGDVISGGNGWRLKEGAPSDTGAVLVVDDTCMTGNSLRAIRPVVNKHYEGREIIFSTVYVNPMSQVRPDVWAVDLPWPHILEWNLFNSVLLPSCAFDFDGILCRDCRSSEDDDGQEYLKFLENAQPLYPVRKQSIPLIITARLEKYREHTLGWLQKWNIRVDELVMGPWKSLAERHRADICEFKARHYRQFRLQRNRPGPPLLIESDRMQAERIAKLSKGIVVCPSAGRCFQG